MSLPVKVLIAENCDHLRQAFSNIINQAPGVQLLAAVCNGRQLVEQAAVLQPDIVQTAIHMPEMDGIEACRQLQNLQPEIGKIVISLHGEFYAWRQMADACTRGFLLVNAPRAEILHCIEVVHKGGLYCNAGATRILNQNRQPANYLTPFEYEVIRRMHRGQSTETIAAETFSSKSKVNQARAELKRKSGAGNEFCLGLWAMQNGYINPKDCEKTGKAIATRAL